MFNVPGEESVLCEERGNRGRKSSRDPDNADRREEEEEEEMTSFRSSKEEDDDQNSVTGCEKFSMRGNRR